MAAGGPTEESRSPLQAARELLLASLQAAINGSSDLRIPADVTVHDRSTSSPDLPIGTLHKDIELHAAAQQLASLVLSPSSSIFTNVGGTPVAPNLADEAAGANAEPRPAHMTQATCSFT